jgi:hypothetical protein
MRFDSRAVCRRLPAWFVLLLALCSCGHEAGAAGRKKRDPTIAIRFHVEVTQSDPTFATKVTAGDPPREITVEKLASISELDIASFYPYKASDGTYSAVLQLDEHGRITLQTLSAESRGKSIVAAINGQPRAVFTVDKTISDGVIFIPRGLTEGEIKQMGESFDLLGKDYNPGKEEKQGSNATPKPPLYDR